MKLLRCNQAAERSCAKSYGGDKTDWTHSNHQTLRRTSHPHPVLESAPKGNGSPLLQLVPARSFARTKSMAPSEQAPNEWRGVLCDRYHEYLRTPLPLYVCERPANEPSNLPPIETPLASFHSAPAVNKAESLGNDAPVTTKFAVGNSWKVAVSEGSVIQSCAQAIPKRTANTLSALAATILSKRTPNSLRVSVAAWDA